MFTIASSVDEMLYQGDRTGIVIGSSVFICNRNYCIYLQILSLRDYCKIEVFNLDHKSPLQCLAVFWTFRVYSAVKCFEFEHNIQLHFGILLTGKYKRILKL
jgi:hypothetical protein